MTYRGRFEDLKAIVARLGYSGAWSDVRNGHRFDADSGETITWYGRTGTVQCQGRKVLADAMKARLSAALAPGADAGAPAASSQTPTADERVFVVHGHDRAAREQLELILHKLDLEHFVLMNTGGDGLTIIEALENEMGPEQGRCRFGIVLMTPDDFGYSKADGPEKAQPRARQNVVFEMGMLIAALGRPNVAILQKGFLEAPSDAQGILYIPFNDHVREAVPRLVDRLRKAGFRLAPEDITAAST